MYRGFDLTAGLLKENFKASHNEGLIIFLKDKVTVEENINKFVLNNGALNGTAMQNNWFPQIKADVFISHSHQNEEAAITLAGWLWKTFSIKAFIDSCIWGYSNKLLKIIDDDKCKQTDGYYNYELRNSSTSHVHMMLSTALSMMIDKTECLFFLNTPESIKIDNVLSTTNSPWIYSEISMSQLLRQNTPLRLRITEENKLFAKGGVLNEEKRSALRFEYETNLKHLPKITFETLKKWKNMCNEIPRKGEPLDKLYDLVPPQNRPII